MQTVAVRKMTALSRPKACVACAESKRRCDKQLPECQRCIDRDMDCIYPQPKRRRRNLVACDSQVQELSPTISNFGDIDPSALGSDFDVWDWGATGTADLDVSLSDMVIPSIPQSLSAPVAGLSAQGIVSESDNLSTVLCPWFLQDETWLMKHCNQEPACVTFVELEPLIHAVEEMLQCWVKDGFNSFIHRRLYQKGLPTCMQDAFTTLAAYHSRTPATKETILQIAEERSSALTRQSSPNSGGAQGILAHLARVQALFIYEFIRLFDGSVRPRASAEKQLPTLRRWVILLWEAVKQYRVEDSSLGRLPLQWTSSVFDRGYDTSSEMWQLWILTESVRRSHLIIDTIANLYDTMTKGWADCAGAVMFTARRGLWEAESAVKWSELSCEKTPLLVPSLQPEPLIAQYSADELDDFAKLYWTFIVGPDKIQCWIDRSS